MGEGKIRVEQTNIAVGGLGGAVSPPMGSRGEASIYRKHARNIAGIMAIVGRHF